ncbi:bifunctional cytidylyltransferase/SDR family oxidoreductase [Streptomyces sp. HNM0574]|uniref:bifunctional cytidylyltransferase/SDR family oxidoreductase n=1 Tax=Streptomyces sp. HNM0574 TaxID=2714954 RepID=UPI00146C87C6|nr:bifunctional cytidylyltransferase/SDR family oxidoreductase [Streptomyces sp. HNM0574]NLU67388.1 bifunctional cytidylyltransferase/SDR family oxidoreductase [Streptomyces sp. HNM0574]
MTAPTRAERRTSATGPLHNTAVVLAAGTGERVGLGTPKQLVKIAGKTILEHTLTVFELAPGIDDIVVMMTPGYVGDAEKIVDKAGLTKVTHILEGGASRNATTERALAALAARLPEGEDQNVVLHDAVRPLLSQEVIASCLTALETYRAVDVAIPSADTIIVTRPHGDDGEWITDIPDRNRLRRGQTPQAFRLSTLREAYARAAKDPNFVATDDCSVVLTYLPDVPVDVVVGDEHNMKITEPVDIHLADRLFQLSSHTVPPRPDDSAYRKLLADKTLVVFGGSSGIGADLAGLAEHHGARVFRHSRSTTDTYVERLGDAERALAEAHESTGRVDFVVNTAAILRIGRLAEFDDALVRETLDVNYLGPVLIAKAAHPYLAASKGHFLLFTSSSYTRGRAEYSLYSSTKAAMVNLVQALADEWAEDGIRTNCVNPERTRTPMRLQAFGEEPPSTLLTSEAVARTSLDVLLSSLTGHVIDVRLDDPMENAS